MPELKNAIFSPVESAESIAGSVLTPLSSSLCGKRDDEVLCHHKE